MDDAKLRAAREILGARSETETVDKALDYVVFTSEVFAAIDSLVALGGVDDIHAPRKGAGRKVAER